MARDSSFLGERVLMRRFLLCVLFVLPLAGACLATVFGTVRGIVHDPQHRPVSEIQVVLKAKASEFTLSARTDDAGQFHFDAVPLGEYMVAVLDPNFVADQQTVAVLSGTAPILHFELRLPRRTKPWSSPPTPLRRRPSPPRLSSPASKSTKPLLPPPPPPSRSSPTTS